MLFADVCQRSGHLRTPPGLRSNLCSTTRIHYFHSSLTLVVPHAHPDEVSPFQKNRSGLSSPDPQRWMETTKFLVTPTADAVRWTRLERGDHLYREDAAPPWGGGGVRLGQVLIRETAARQTNMDRL